MALKDIEIRILGALIEKERTTPESYPLTSNSLMLACNQKTNREPVCSYSQNDIEAALMNLRDKGLIHTLRAANERSFKHRHKLAETLSIGAKDFALLAVLMLRGQQTPGELRGRTERYLPFKDITEVEVHLKHLADHNPPLVKNLGRGPGQGQDRWLHTLGTRDEERKPRLRSKPHAQTSNQPSELETLKQTVQTLRTQVKELYEHLQIPYPQDE